MPFKKYLIVLILILFLSPLVSYTQKKPDQDYSELQKSFAEHLNAKDSVKALDFAVKYLQKAKNERDTLKIMTGYYLRIISDQKKSELFDLYDTIIDLSKNQKSSNFPTIAYFDKGIIYHKNQQFKKALDNFLKAIKYNKGSNKAYMEFLLNENIARLKLRIDKNEEALDLIRGCWQYANENNVKAWNPNEYYSVLYFLSDSYRKLDSLDAAKEHIKIGLTEDNTSDEGKSYYKFLMLSGTFKTISKKYEEAEKDLLEAINGLEKADKHILASAYYFLGNNYRLSEKDELAVKNFKKVDSIFELTGDIMPEHAASYQYVIDYYENKKDFELQLKYIQKLIRVDSTLIKNYKYLNGELTDKFDFPKLIKRKEEIIDKLEREKRASKISNFILILLSLLILTIAIYQYQKRIIYKKRFLELVQNDSQSSDEKIIVDKNDSVSIDVPDEVINEVLDKLSSFEEQFKFTDSQINLNSLASQLGTNSNYLSKVINHFKKKSFSSYIKDLRISYGFQRLKNEATFRKYTIKAIAQECGFKTAESFSKTFYKAYGIYPSYFIKKMDKLKII